MISDGIPGGHPEYLGPYFLWRLLIDARLQGRGFGKAALDLVADHVRTRPDAHVLLTSVVPGPACPIPTRAGPPRRAPGRRAGAA
jgi:diamine N-acetyltransferase